MLLVNEGGEETNLSDEELRVLLTDALKKLGPKKRVLIVPPDFTRYHSNAGFLTQVVWDVYGPDVVVDIMPALGTHHPVTKEQREKMFGTIPESVFRVHDWRNDVVTVGHVPAKMVKRASHGLVDEPWPAQVNRLLWEGGHDCIISIGQVVPHEVMGMANYNKNIFVGVGGPEAINLSHFIGAAFGIERIMGVANNPLRQILNYASRKFLKSLPLVYVLTVRGSGGPSGDLVTRGLFVGDDEECFNQACLLSLKVNFIRVPKLLNKVVVHLDEHEYQSTWLGNKSIYRTRMAIADNGELVVLAPGVKAFGEDGAIDQLIRKYGYRKTPEIMQNLKESAALRKNLSAAAHLIHGSPEGRFTVTLCAGHLTREEVESVGFSFGDLSEMMTRYPIASLKDGVNTMPDGEEIFFIRNPAVGLWAAEEKLVGRSTADEEDITVGCDDEEAGDNNNKLVGDPHTETTTQKQSEEEEPQKKRQRLE